MDPCCAGFGFLNVSRLKGKSDNKPLTCIQDFAAERTVSSMIFANSQHLLMVGGEGGVVLVHGWEGRAWRGEVANERDSWDMTPDPGPGQL